MVTTGHDYSHRHFYFWCPNCATKIHVETAEGNDDDARNVDCVVDSDVGCPMCQAPMRNSDVIMEPVDGSWPSFDAWRARQPASTHFQNCARCRQPVESGGWPMQSPDGRRFAVCQPCSESFTLWLTISQREE